MLYKRLLICTLLSGLILFSFPVFSQAESRPIVIDPGHGGSDSGAVGPTRYAEKTANLDIGLRIEKLLRRRGIPVVLTRSTDISPNTPPRDLTANGTINVSDDLQARVDIANRVRARAFVSIHNNSGPSSARGSETYYWSSTSSAESRRLATLIQKELTAEIGLANRGVKGARFYVLRRTNMPAALVEGAFISNPTEEALLKTPSFRQKIARAVFNGILKYLGQTKPEPSLKKLRIKPNGRVSLSLNKYFYDKGVSARVISNNQVVAERTMNFQTQTTSGGTSSLGARNASKVWHFAEGFTGDGFDTWLILTNMRSKSTVANLKFMTSSGVAKRKRIRLRAKSRTSVYVNNIMRGKSFSLRVSTRLPIVAERSVYFNSGDRSGGHSTVGVRNPNKKWYFVGGYQADTHDTWLLLSNPGRFTTEARISYSLPNGQPGASQVVKMKPFSRQSIYVNGQISGEPSIVVAANRKIVAERTVYFKLDNKTGANNTFGARRPGKRWFFAEGNTNKGYNEHLVLRNFGAEKATVKIDYLLARGSRKTRWRVVEGNSLLALNVNASSEAGMRKMVATRLKSSQPIVAERSVYFDTADGRGGSSSIGSPLKSKRWLFAEGFTGEGFDTKLVITNPNSRVADVKVYFYK